MSKILDEIDRVTKARQQLLEADRYGKASIVEAYDEQLAALWAQRRREKAGALAAQPIPQNPTRIRRRDGV